MSTASYRSLAQQAERIFWIGFLIGLAWGFALGGTFALWVTA